MILWVKTALEKSNMWEMNCFGGNPPNSLVAVSNQTHQNNGDIPVVFPTITSDFINISLPADLEEATIELFSRSLKAVKQGGQSGQYAMVLIGIASGYVFFSCEVFYR